MTKTRLALSLGFAILCFSCGRADHEMAESQALADSTSNTFISSSAAVERNTDTARKFIRTADLKFKVKNVIQATYNIEEITGKQGGFVTFTNLTSQIDNTTVTAISADSSLETTHYTVTNSIVLRVPNTALDATLKEISGNIDFLDYRVITAQDIALDILSNNLTQKRAAQNEKRLTDAIDSRGKKLKETTTAEELLSGKQEQADHAAMANLSLTDQVRFSTISLHIYQRQSVKRELIANNKNIDAYEPGLGHKLMESFTYGWKVLTAFLVFLAKLWGLFLSGLIAYILYKVYKNKRKT